MATVTIEMSDLRQELKAAVREVLDERRASLSPVIPASSLRGAISEALEEIALLRAIEDGAGTEDVSRAEVLRALGTGA